ncbi:uncharacterized protein J3D65DRAFT_298476 [Phyllosticta citribraziliensis]|uniref:LysM domain-containing protein n=1 Tax=Phyllosticta citribraziliensis TaxID=989973 RepID=A0ABR1LXA7_9PEZI
MQRTWTGHFGAFSDAVRCGPRSTQQHPLPSSIAPRWLLSRRMNPTSTEHSTRRSSSQLTSDSSLRPRNKRLLSGLDEEDEFAVRSLEGSRNASPFSPRSISPIPSPGPSRTGSSLAAQRAGYSGTTSAARGQSPAGFAQDPLSSLSGSWSTLQGFASSLLGSAAGGAESPRRRRPLDSTSNRTTTSSVPPEWGPRAENKIGEGYEDRASLVRAMKRRDLLQANGHLNMDATGRFKRRNSDERISSSAPPTEHDDREALAYIHRVRPEDTLAGITIKYNCDAAMVRKANRMWPNDTVQSRRHLVIPVDACGVKGKPVPAPEPPTPQPQQQPQQQSNVEDDLLLPTPKSEYPTIHSTSLPTNGWHGPASVSSSNLNQSGSQANNAEPPWRHEAWVQFPNSDTPVEIARLHRRDLGFFPPARRKSLTYSDTTQSVGGSTGGPSHTHTPSASLDLQRSETATSTTSSGSRITSQQRHTRTPSISQSFKLDGPGGVGTFNRNVRKPGPAQDGLNKLFGQHLPSLAPPAGKDYFGTWNPATLEGTAGAAGPGEGISGAATPVVGVGGVGGSTSGTGFDLEQVGGAIEGWMRKVATKASSLVPPAGSIPTVKSPGLGATRSPGARGGGASGGGGGANMAMGMGGDINDLIELTDSFEIGDDDDDEAGRGRAASGRAGGSAHLRRREGRSGSGTPAKSTKGE